MKNNKVHYSLALCLIVITSLFLLSALPPFSIGNWKFRSVDLLADIKETPREEVQLAITDSIQNDSVQAEMDSAVQVMKLSCPEGMTCIEDYSSDSTALDNFLKALAEGQTETSPVRIAMYGDSFIEGDVFCGSVRDTLQTLFGGRGVGYVPITSELVGFRNTIRQSFDNWKTISLIKKDSTVSAEIGPSGFCFIPQPENWVKYKTSKQRYLREFSTVKLYYKSTGDARLAYTVNDSLADTVSLKNSNKLNEWKYHRDQFKSIKFEFNSPGNLALYGASFEGPEGIFVDNFSMRGNSGIVLYNVADKMYEDFNAYRDYKLIILQYGLNVIAEDSMRYAWYASKMIKVVNKIKRVFPSASLLLVSISDRSTNTAGSFETIKSLPALRNAQRYVAKETGIAFWDLYEAMGGQNSMVKFAEASPALAAKDYTHLTFKGGKKLAQLLVNSLLYEKEKYEQKVGVQ